VSRTTMVGIFEQLKAEGFVVSGHGSGTYVCRINVEQVAIDLSIQNISAHVSNLQSSTPLPGELKLSTRGTYLDQAPLNRYGKGQPFSPGNKDDGLFPLNLWTRLQQRHLRAVKSGGLQARERGGLLALRNAIAEYLRVARGVRCEPEQVIITQGTNLSLDLVTRLLCDAGDCAWVESPCYWPAAFICSANGLALHPVDVDEEGMAPPGYSAVSSMPTDPSPRLVYLTPSHQFPLGGVMPIGRRMAWLDFARQRDCMLVEDDYDSEYRFSGAPIPSLQGLDTHGRVIYLGTFSKTLFAGIRIAFAVVPQTLVRSFSEAASYLYHDGDLVQQAVLADFIRDGHYAAHLRRTRVVYGERRTALTSALQRMLPDAFNDGRIRFSGAEAGVHLTMLLPIDVDDVAIAKAAGVAGVTAIPLSAYCIGQPRSGLVFSYAATPPQEIQMLAQRLGETIRTALTKKTSANSVKLSPKEKKANLI